jgi:purine-cytosine permease-like protein
MYHYLFYKLYRYYEKGPSVWWSDWKASLSLIVLEIWLIASILIYYKIFLNPSADIIGSEGSWILLVIIIALIDYFAFHHRDQWKQIVIEFDNLPKRTNRIGGLVVFGFALLIIVNFILSFYLYYQT